jgi:hypothetical protein
VSRWCGEAAEISDLVCCMQCRGRHHASYDVSPDASPVFKLLDPSRLTVHPLQDRRFPTHSCGAALYLAGPNLFTPLLNNSRLILSFNNTISRFCHSRENGCSVHFRCTRFLVSYSCGDSSAEPFTAFFFLIRSTQSTDFGAFH